MITAIVLVRTEIDAIPQAAAAIAALDSVSEVYSVTGDVDLVAIVRVAEHDQLADVIADRMSRIAGVTSTRTYLAFRAYSKHDLEAAFALGLGE
jgi:DNA-binding Lrp family transcriptional regulator